MSKYVLTVETHEGEIHSHQLSFDEYRALCHFATSMTPRKKLLKNFFESIKNQPEGKFLHIQKWLENILSGSKTKFFTVQMLDSAPQNNGY